MFVSEIFRSFHGEVNGHHQGRMVTFVRFSGCNLRCHYCDTKRTWDPLFGENLDIPEIVARIKNMGNQYVCFTGGEPLLDKSKVIELSSYLYHEGYKISVETNGTIDITPFFRFVDSFVLDYKMQLTPASGPEVRIISNFSRLRPTDVVKFLVSSEEEVLEAKNAMEHISLIYYPEAVFAFSPLLPNMTAERLGELLYTHDIRNAVLSLQMHKIIGYR